MRAVLSGALATLACPLHPAWVTAYRFPPAACVARPGPITPGAAIHLSHHPVSTCERGSCRAECSPARNSHHHHGFLSSSSSSPLADDPAEIFSLDLLPQGCLSQGNQPSWLPLCLLAAHGHVDATSRLCLSSPLPLAPDTHYWERSHQSVCVPGVTGATAETMSLSTVRAWFLTNP